MNKHFNCNERWIRRDRKREIIFLVKESKRHRERKTERGEAGRKEALSSPLLPSTASLVRRVDPAVCLTSDTPIQSSLWSAEAGLSEDCRVREERMEAADSRPFKKSPLLMASGAPTMECTSVNKD